MFFAAPTASPNGATRISQDSLEPAQPGTIETRLWLEEHEWLYDLLRNKFYIDDAYQWVINRVVLVVAGAVSWYDRAVVNDTGVNGPADLTRFGGFLLKFHETGRMPNYALAMTLGIVVLAVIAFFVGT